ncbi:MAG: hypothetical protein FWF32_07660 [Endomicrobia bacterium]|nr:hypothetical protein [Endomicrobiia bacterium]
MKKIEVYEIDDTQDFQKNVKRFVNKKDFKKLPTQIKELMDDLIKGDFPGTKISHKDLPTPHDVYKLRMAIPDINVGKSDGYRIIYMVVTEFKIVVFLTIYYKKESPTVSDTYIGGLIDGYFIHSPTEDAPEKE